MTRQERVRKEISTGFDLLRFFLANPKAFEDVPDGAYVDVVSSDHHPLQVPPGETVVLFQAVPVFRKIDSAA